MRKLPARKLLGSVVAAALMMPQTAWTLGLGEIEVNSALNQRLKADIELLSASPEDVETVIVKLASRKEFTRAGLDRPFLLNDLSFKADVVDGQPMIMVSSGSPIREPYLSFLVEIDWPNGHMLREYTVLLDPPVFMTQQATPAVGQTSSAASEGFRPGTGAPESSANIVPVAAPSASVSPRPAASESTGDRFAEPEPAAVEQPRPAQSSSVSAPVFINQQAQTINQQPGTYRVQSGDTAWSLADSMRPDQSISVEQMMIALLRANPESFINENINGLKRGYILRVPDYDKITAVSQEEARSITREHAALWREYQASQSGTPASAMTSSESGGSALGADTASEGEIPDDAYLEIVSAGSGASLGGKDPTEMTAEELRAELALARERVETERVEKEALQSRVQTLESRVDKMKGMLSIEDAELAEVQSINQPEDSLDAMQADLEEAIETGLDEDMSQSDGEMADEDMVADSAGEEASEPLSVDDADMDEQLASDEEAVFVDDMEDVAADAAEQDSMSDSEALDDMASEPVPPQQDIISPQPAPVVSQRPSDPLSRLLSDPMMLAAAGGGLLLIAALISLLIKRRRAAAESEEDAFEPLPDSGDSLEDIADDVASVADDAQTETHADELEGDETVVTGSDEAGTDFDSDSTMILNGEDTVVAESAESAAGEEEARDDVIAEADVYLAYGIYQQAEELLNQAISDSPDRDEYRVKLAETHYAAKSKDNFMSVATELNSRLDDDSPLWKKVVGMGQDLCAEEPLFQGSMVGAPVAALAPDEPSMDFDLGLEASPDESSPASGEQSPDLDLSMDLPADDAAADSTEEPALDASDLDAAELDQAASETDDDMGELEFDLEDTGAVEESDSDSTDDDFSLDIDASELDINTDDTAPVTEAEAEAVDLSDLDLDTSDDVGAGSADDTAEDAGLDFALDDSDDTSSTDDVDAISDDEMALDLTEEAAELDMGLDDDGAIDLSEEADLNETPAEDDSEAVVDIRSDEEDVDLSSLDDVDEVSTKLDLARAYLDMGDHEGTRGILEEVLAEGNDAQKEEANDLLAKLD